MTNTELQFGIKEALEQLNIKAVNNGTWIGQTNFSDEILESFSPVDGELIAKVKTSTSADYEK